MATKKLVVPPIALEPDLGILSPPNFCYLEVKYFSMEEKSPLYGMHIEGFYGPFTIRHRKSRSEAAANAWSQDELNHLAASSKLCSATHSADYIDPCKEVAQCVCWRLSAICSLFQAPRFNHLVCPSCRDEGAECIDNVKRRIRIYFDHMYRPVGKIFVGQACVDEQRASTACQPSRNISSSCSFDAPIML